MAKEPTPAMKRIQPTHGVYAGTQIDLPTADAESAISEGWAIDPYAEVDPKAEPKEFDQEAHDKATAAADAAVRKMRGEPEPAAEKKPARASSSDDDTSYQTRQRQPAPGKPKT